MWGFMIDAGSVDGAIIRECSVVTKDRYGAVAALLAGAGAWGLLWYPLRAFARHGLSGVWLAVMLFAGASVAGLLLGRARKRAVTGPWRVWLALAVLGGVTNVGFVLAVLHDNILRVTLLFYLSPVWSVLLARVFLRERFGLVVLAGIAAALGGTVVLLWRDATLGLRFPDVLALISGASFAAANVTLRAHPRLSLEAKVVSTFVGVVLVGLLVLGFGGHGGPSASGPVLAVATVFGGLGVFVMTWLVQYGVTALPVRQSAVILLFEVITAAFSQHVLLHTVLGAQAWWGTAIIALGATVVGAHES